MVAWAQEVRERRQLSPEGLNSNIQGEDEVSSFSISNVDEDDDENGADGPERLDLPLSLQEQLAQEHERIQQDLTRRVEESRMEIDSNRVAFDRYRDRARETLRSAIAEQKSLENKLATVQEDYKV